MAKSSKAAPKGSTNQVEEELIERASMGMQALPMLDVIFGRMGTVLNGTLKSRASLLAEVSQPEVTYTTWTKAIESVGEFGVCGVVEAVPLSGNAIVALDQEGFYATIETQMSGTPRPGTAPSRAPSLIERRLAHRLVSLISDAMSENFTRLTEVTFRLDSIESAKQVSSLHGEGAPCALVHFDMMVGECTGFIKIVLPLTTLEPARKVLSKMFLGEKLGGDGTWREAIMERISGSSVSVAAVLHEVSLDLGEIIEWKPGTQIDLGIDDSHEATVMCSGIPIFHGAIGRRKNNTVALRITREEENNSEEEEGGSE